MICREPDTPGRARVIGSLIGDSVQLLLDAVNGGVEVLDLSEVYQLDHNAVRALARLWPWRCSLLACPRWLTLGLARLRCNGEASARLMRRARRPDARHVEVSRVEPLATSRR
jgi:hypothetical protein